MKIFLTCCCSLSSVDVGVGVVGIGDAQELNDVEEEESILTRVSSDRSCVRAEKVGKSAAGRQILVEN